MNDRNSMKGKLLLAIFLLVPISVVLFKTTSHGRANVNASVADEKWEYLALAGPSTTNFSPTGNPGMRKEPASSFGREAFVLEQHLDKLGAQGWELVAVAGPPLDPAYYFKRRK